jgi:hypothetical protein
VRKLNGCGWASSARRAGAPQASAPHVASALGDGRRGQGGAEHRSARPPRNVSGCGWASSARRAGAPQASALASA